MKKAAKKKAVAQKSKPAKKRTTSKPVQTAKKKTTIAAKNASPATLKTARQSDGKLSFNHAMIYLKDVARGIDFYRDWLGFKLIEDFRHEGKSVYARMRAPGGDGTIALHQAGPGASINSDGVRLYFEVPDLDDFCQKLRKRGFYFTQLPQMMPWGWRHAYLNDPEGHEISLYWAGELRMKKTVMEAAAQAGNR
jgi:catechol 2,3-dioxygenase-like lactoylglutathione lyase family enzyme